MQLRATFGDEVALPWIERRAVIAVLAPFVLALYAKLGASRTVAIIGKDSGLARLDQPNFIPNVLALYAELGESRANAIIGEDSGLARLDQPNFIPNVLALYAELGESRANAIIGKGSGLARLDQPNFITNVFALYDALGESRANAIIGKDSGLARLDQPNFIPNVLAPAVDHLCSRMKNKSDVIDAMNAKHPLSGSYVVLSAAAAAVLSSTPGAAEKLRNAGVTDATKWYVRPSRCVPVVVGPDDIQPWIRIRYTGEAPTPVLWADLLHSVSEGGKFRDEGVMGSSRAVGGGGGGGGEHLQQLQQCTAAGPSTPVRVGLLIRTGVCCTGALMPVYCARAGVPAQHLQLPIKILTVQMLLCFVALATRVSGGYVSLVNDSGVWWFDHDGTRILSIVADHGAVRGGRGKCV